MSKKSFKNRRKKEIIQNSSQSQIPIEPTLQPKEKSKRNFWIVIGGVASIIAIILAIPSLYDLTLTSKEKFDNEHTIKGEIKSPKISNYTILDTLPDFNIEVKQPSIKQRSYPLIKGVYIKGLSQMPYIMILVGTQIIMCQTSNLYRGINLFGPAFKNCSNYVLGIAAKDDRVYVSAKFIDLITDHEMGKMVFNHWTLYKDEILDYNSADDRLEVVDHQGNIAFSMIYVDKDTNNPFLSIAGYFVSPQNVLILGDPPLLPNHKDENKKASQDCILKSDSGWLQKAKTEIDEINTVFH